MERQQVDLVGLWEERTEVGACLESINSFMGM